MKSYLSNEVSWKASSATKFLMEQFEIQNLKLEPPHFVLILEASETFKKAFFEMPTGKFEWKYKVMCACYDKAIHIF